MSLCVSNRLFRSMIACGRCCSRSSWGRVPSRTPPCSCGRKLLPVSCADTRVKRKTLPSKRKRITLNQYSNIAWKSDKKPRASGVFLCPLPPAPEFPTRFTPTEGWSSGIFDAKKTGCERSRIRGISWSPTWSARRRRGRVGRRPRPGGEVSLLRGDRRRASRSGARVRLPQCAHRRGQVRRRQRRRGSG